MKGKIFELRQLRAEKLGEAMQLVEAAEAEERDLNEKEQVKYDGLKAEAEELDKRMSRLGEAQEWKAGLDQIISSRQAPAQNKIGRGDTEIRAMAHFYRTGDGSGLQKSDMELRASNDTTMNITTAADGQYLVPTGLYNEVIVKRDEMALPGKLGVRKITGKGTTVRVPVDNEDDGEFVSTAESNAFDRDAPATTYVDSTLVKYTKKMDFTVELLEDEDANLMAFVQDFLARGLAKTQNSLLLTEVASNGTALKTFASATAIAVDELEPIVYNDALSAYLDDTPSVAWVMRSSVHGEIVLLDDANQRRYASNAMGDGKRNLLGYPVSYSAKSGATAASTKSVYFGNWYYVGYREAPGLTVIRDPYSRAGYGELLFHYFYRCDFNVLQAEAIGYGVHPSA